MVIFHSVRLFLWGITKRCYYWAPFLFLDLFDIYEIYIKPRLPADWGGGIVLPAWWGFVLFSLMLFWAAILTYHELRTEKDALLPQLDEKQRRANIGDTLTRLIISGKELSTLLGWGYSFASLVGLCPFFVNALLGSHIDVPRIEN